MKNLILFLSMLFAQSCLEKDEVLPKAMPYAGNQLRIDGYYYQVAYDGVIYNSNVMYANGVLITLWGAENTLEEMDEYIRKYSIQNTGFMKSKYNWGVYFVDDTNNILIYTLGSSYPHRETVQEGIVLNDTTFKITKYTYNGVEKGVDEIYHFREFSPKPDSTNVYIK